MRRFKKVSTVIQIWLLGPKDIANWEIACAKRNKKLENLSIL